MRLATALVLILAAACSSEGDPSELGVPPQPRQPRVELGLEPELREVDLDDLRKVKQVDDDHQLEATPCEMPAAELQGWADENLSCGVCYALRCGGELGAHVCTRQCEDDLRDTVDP
jgi:hypothetical protein